MSQEKPFVSLQIYRPVIETPELLRFMTKVDEIGLDTIPPRQSVVIPDETEREVRPRGVARHRMYDPENLKVLLLDRRSPKDGFSALSRAYMKLEPSARAKTANKQTFDWRKEMRRSAAAKSVGGDGDILDHVTFDNVTILMNPDYGVKGRELSLQLDPSSMDLLQLVDESNVAFEALRSINPRLIYPTAKLAIELAFARVPASAENDLTLAFVQAIKNLLPVTLSLGAPIAKLNS